ncbi:MAG: bifunctional phosphoribosyl-AMP cyclohydrolase/phosphoribosyl-ATP diphosphatase HisIE [Bdellovibrionaceae bacterium]|nr:bifunctional phosphoribosyl-AMP cyclohydrolase/phosphoribosyl-ATP diphosphatase HisIE [Pseudobdellovibrionaceae bacterium]
MMNTLKFDATTGLIPAIVQNAATQEILMQAYMNAESFKMTLETQKLTFFSRSRQELWTKGESSGHYLNLVSWSTDCDSDSLLFQALPIGPTCHLGTTSCFKDSPGNPLSFLISLEQTIAERFKNRDTKTSYVASLAIAGIDKIAQKVGEEAVETVIAAKNNNSEDFKNEAADLLFHYLVLLKAKNINLAEIVSVLQQRSSK